MALLGLTSAQAKLAKWVIRAAGEAIPAGLAWLGSGLAANVEGPGTLEWRRFVVAWSRTTPTGTMEDKAQFKLDLVNITADELDTSWTSGDFSAVLAAVNTFKTAVTAHVATTQTWNELRAYRMVFNPVPDVLRPFADTGAPVYKIALTGAGTGAAGMPYQIGPTVTFRTGWPRHWGRVYMPTPGTNALDSTGRLTSTYRDAVATAWQVMLGNLHDGGFVPVVPVGQLAKAPFHALLGIDEISVDDVPDVQRRRRPKMVAARSVVG